MTHFVVLLITLRVILCPLFCGVEEFFASSPIRQDESQVTAINEVMHSCCHHCQPEPVVPDDCPNRPCPTCDCFCNESAIIGVKISFDDWSSSAWEAYQPHQDHYLAANVQSHIELRTDTRSPQVSTGRIMRLTLASLLI